MNVVPAEAAAPPAHRYRAFGLRIASEMALPELAPLQDASHAPPDVTIRVGRHGAPVDAPPTSRLTVDAGGATFVMEGVGHYRVEDGCRIQVMPRPGATDTDVRLYLLGSAFGVLCHQRGLLPLHGNALVVDGRVMAFCGRSGIGKSTLAAHFAARGYAILCDDVCVVSFATDGRPMAWPGLPRLKLWRDAAESFGHDPGVLARAIAGKDKYHVPNPAVGSHGPFPLARVYVLSDTTPDLGDIDRITGIAAVRTVMAQTYRKVYLRPMDLLGTNIEHATRLARHARIYAAPRRRGFDHFEAEAARLERHMTQSDGAAEGRT